MQLQSRYHYAYYQDQHKLLVEWLLGIGVDASRLMENGSIRTVLRLHIDRSHSGPNFTLPTLVTEELSTYGSTTVDLSYEVGFLTLRWVPRESLV